MKHITKIILLIMCLITTPILAAEVKVEHKPEHFAGYCAAAYFVEAQQVGQNKLGGMYFGYYLYFINQLIKNVNKDEASAIYRMYKNKFLQDPFEAVTLAIITCTNHLPR